MPASSPPVDAVALASLATLGSRIRARRTELGLSMNATAESAGVSRVTLHRIERGGPSVTMGAYLNVLTAVGLDLEVTRANGPPAGTCVRIGHYPQLRLVAWQLDEDTKITEAEALALYERNWRHVQQSAMPPREQRFLQHLVDTCGHGRLLVQPSPPSPGGDGAAGTRRRPSAG